MRAGQLRHWCEYQVDRGGAVDAAGQAAENWQGQFRFWADIAQQAASENAFAQQVLARGGYLVRTRYQRGFAVTGRIVLLETGKTFQIEALRDVEERHVELEIAAVAIETAATL